MNCNAEDVFDLKPAKMHLSQSKPNDSRFIQMRGNVFVGITQFSVLDNRKELKYWPDPLGECESDL